MATLNITNRTISGLVIREDVYEDGTALFTGAATWPVGAVLGKITASGKYARYSAGASDGSQVPVAILAASTTAAGAGDVLIRPLISGFVRRGKLVDAAGAALTQAAVDQLRDFTIIAQPTTQLSIQDNQ